MAGWVPGWLARGGAGCLGVWLGGCLAGWPVGCIAAALAVRPSVCRVVRLAGFLLSARLSCCLGGRRPLVCLVARLTVCLIE